MKTPESNRDYSRRRAAEERAAAEGALDERAAEAHRDLARQFDTMASDGMDSRADHPPQSPGILSGDFRIIP